MVAVPPAVDRSLDQATLSSQRRVEIRESPAHRVTLGLVDQPVPPVLVLAATGARVDTVLRLEFLVEVVHVDGFNIAPDRVFHLDAIAGVFKGNPLDAVVVLPDDKRSRGRDWTGCGTGTGANVRAGMVRAPRRQGPARCCG